MKKTFVYLVAAAVLAATPGMAAAHGSTKPQHGGVVQMTGETLFEIVREPTGVALYVVDEDEPINAAAMTAKLNIAVSGKKSEVMMVPGKGNRFFAKGLKLAKGANVGVQVVNKATRARYGTTFLIK